MDLICCFCDCRNGRWDPVLTVSFHLFFYVLFFFVYVQAQSGMFGSKSGVTMLPVLQFSVQHLAEELALIDGELLRHIRINELEDCVWMKKNKVRDRQTDRQTEREREREREIERERD